jgi:hypothetical protein
MKLIVVGRPDHFLPWLAEQKRQSDLLRSLYPNRLADPVFAQSTGDPNWQRFTLATNFLAFAPKLDRLFLEVVRDKRFGEAVRKW